mmetsp:Transcript_6708/g.18734  ORF Transcript_6708/g.18734 Transcript_6708/m.18734 type:complete len:243 (+) Transcript_6708:339-1067(+)
MTMVEPGEFMMAPPTPAPCSMLSLESKKGVATLSRKREETTIMVPRFCRAVPTFSENTVSMTWVSDPHLASTTDPSRSLGLELPMIAISISLAPLVCSAMSTAPPRAPVSVRPCTHTLSAPIDTMGRRSSSATPVISLPRTVHSSPSLSFMHCTNICWLSSSGASSSVLVMENGQRRMCGRVPNAPMDRAACTTERSVVHELMVMHSHVEAEAVGREDSTPADRRRRVRTYRYAGESMVANK